MQDFSFTGYNSDMKERARLLRKSMTTQEKHLWYDFLQNHNLRFLRQKIIENYIVDFYCAKAKLVIEIDGGQHYSDEAVKYDIERSNIFSNYGLKVIRFTNTDIDKNFEGVCQYIEQVISESLHR